MEMNNYKIIKILKMKLFYVYLSKLSFFENNY